MEEILKINDLHVSFPTHYGTNIAVDGVNLSVKKGEIFGIVGESGCGKSMTALSVMRLLSASGRITGGEIFIDGENILTLSEKQMQRRIRGKKAAMIFQEPMTSLNPLVTVGEQIAEVLRTHKGMKKKEAKAEAIRFLSLAGIPEPEKRAEVYPHQMSGGMRQRVMIAIAMCCKPDILIADEPTTALDVTVQAQILNLMRSLRNETGTAIVMITHDLGVIADICDRVAVMYCGCVVEEGSVEDVLRHPRHPYTKGLIASVPKMDGAVKYLHNIPGTVPQLHHLPRGCRFADRCPQCTEACREKMPEVTLVDSSHSVRCFACEEESHEG